MFVAIAFHNDVFSFCKFLGHEVERRTDPEGVVSTSSNFNGSLQGMFVFFSWIRIHFRTPKQPT